MQPQAPFLLFHSVTAQAAFGQDQLDISSEVDRLARGGRKRPTFDLVRLSRREYSMQSDGNKGNSQEANPHHHSNILRAGILSRKRRGQLRIRRDSLH
jgi:hypothetical protein